MVVAELLTFRTRHQRVDLADASFMIASALEELAQSLLEEGRPLPVAACDVAALNAELIELVPFGSFYTLLIFLKVIPLSS